MLSSSWTDLVLAGVKPQDVRTLGIDGGPISAFEYRLALALGASVGLMEPSTRAAADLLADPDWRECGGLIGLPDDTRSVQAFLQPPRPALTGEQLEVAAQKIHAAYLEEKHYQNPDPAMKPWDKLFMGAAMSITAFPVLARILAERGLLRSRMGTLAIACAAVDDVTGWCILAYIVVLVRVAHAARPAWMTIAGSVLYVLIMLFVVRRILPAFEREFRKRDRLSDNLLAVIVVLVLASALATEWLGIHLLFGAFLMGAIMPKAPEFTRYLLHKFESVTVVLLLPLFFAFTGLRTRIGVGGGRAIWFYSAIVIVVAITGKLGGSMFAARLAGMPWREAASLGILMNTRGLMELVILNIGLDIGVISPAMFSIMVLMALVTTFMTTPLLEWVYPARLFKAQVDEIHANVA
jgi:Kef-type K+ transport system membrane component KefB